MNALLSWAALIDGLHVLSYDQTGAAQKWGPVLSSLILARPAQAVAANKVGLGQADLYLALDLLAAGTPRQPRPLRPGAHGRGRERVRPAERRDGAQRRASAARRTRSATRSTASREPSANVAVDARRAGRGAVRRLHGRPTCSCWASPTRPGSCRSRLRPSRRPIRLNGVAVEQNLQAFRYGRLWVADPERVRALVEPPARVVRDGARGGARAARRRGRQRVRVAARPVRASRRGRAPDARASASAS